MKLTGKFAEKQNNIISFIFFKGTGGIIQGLNVVKPRKKPLKYLSNGRICGQSDESKE